MTAIKKPLVSVIIRTLNEEKYLTELLHSIESQNRELFNLEIIVVDSGSTDNTLKIAKSFNSRITFINKDDFSFGRSLNIGCEFARGEFFVFVSGHCIPTDSNWIDCLVRPLSNGFCEYTYGRQEPRDSTKFSEIQIFSKYFPDVSQIPQDGFFCNNANAALTRKSWEKYLFDETLTGCEDMELAKRIYKDGNKIGYVAEASVFHIHDETWNQVKTRYEREALALQKIMPDIHLTLWDVTKFFLAGVFNDMKIAISKRNFTNNFISIILFRWSQYLGSYIGNNKSRKLSEEAKQQYFYPNSSKIKIKENYND